MELLSFSETAFMWVRFTRAVNHSSPLTSPSPIRWALIALPVLALSGLLAACGSSSKATTASPTTTVPSGSASAAFAKYTSCLESNGVPASEAGSLFGGRRRPGTGSSTTTPGGTTPVGSVPAGGFTRPTIPAQYQAAFTACASDRPTFGGGGFGRGGISSTAFTAYRNCLEIHGVTLPTTPTTTPGATPPTGGFGGGFGGGSAAVLNTPAGKAAATACASLLPARTGSTTTTTVAG
jgi:hypothetical protein